jgi:hypothetical protein
VRATKGRAADPQAHRLYLLARHLLERFGRDDTTKAIEYLKQAGRLRLNPPIDDVMPTNRLGDWYVNSFSDGRNQLALCVGERTLLPVFLSPPGFRGRLIPAVRWLLETLNIASEIIESELVAMGAWRLAVRGTVRSLDR